MTCNILLAIQSIPIILLLFLLFPRLSGPLFHFSDPRDQAKTGLDHELKPGSMNHLSTSREMVMRITFQGKPVPPSEHYWRGPVFWYTDGQRWKVLGEHPIPRHRRLNPTFSGIAYRYTLMQEPQHLQWVFALDFPATYPAELHITEEFQLFSKHRETQMKSYSLTSYSEYRMGTQLTSREQRLGLQLPDTPTPRIQALVDRWKQNNRPPAEIVELGINFLDQERFTYTLSPPKLGDNPVDEFLFETRQGYCEHYATSFVYLMRVAGVPARVVTGYMGGTFNQIGGFLEVRQANAHAWAEVWLPKQGWTRVDPTYVQTSEQVNAEADLTQSFDPQSTALLPTSASGVSTLSTGWEQLEFVWSTADFLWNTWVIHYSSANQYKVLAQFGITNIRSMIIGVLASLALFAAGLLIFLLYPRRTLVNKAFALYEQFCHKLRRKGLIRQPAETAGDFARRAKRLKPALAPPIDAITQTYIRIRYARKSYPSDIKNWLHWSSNLILKSW